MQSSEEKLACEGIIEEKMEEYKKEIPLQQINRTGNIKAVITTN